MLRELKTIIRNFDFTWLAVGPTAGSQGQNEDSFQQQTCNISLSLSFALGNHAALKRLLNLSCPQFPHL